MATKIYNTDTKEVVELQLVTDGANFLDDVIGGCNQDGMFYSEDMPDEADFAMDAENLDWWVRWAEREQRILDVSQEMGEDAIQAMCDLAGKYGYDMEVLQDKEEEYLGL